MKKLFLAFPIIVLLAAGCNPSQSAYTNSTLAPVVQNTNSIPSSVPAPSSTSSPAQTLNQTDDWKTYVNSNYRYSFKYPKGYFLQRQSYEYVSLWQNDPSKNDIHAETSLLVGFRTYKTHKTLKKFITEESSKYDLVEARPVIINGIAAYEARQTGMLSSYAVIFQNESNIVVLNFNSGQDGNVEKTKAAMAKIQKQILSTFKFIK